MQHEFNSRVAAQRAILQVLNSSPWATEDLFGLSSKAIERWILVNGIDPTSKLVNLTKYAAAKLFFLANKSQEQISDEYKAVASEVSAVCEAIAIEISFIKAPGGSLA